MIMSVANHKGGVGKTTTALTLGHALALLDKRVLLIDLDPQMNLSKTLERSNWDKLVNIHYALRDGEIPLSSLIQNTRIPNLDIVPSSEFLRAADVEFFRKYDFALRLRQQLTDAIRNEDVANVDEQRIRECAMYVRNQNARNPNAMFLAALKEGWDVGAGIRKAVAAGEAMREAERREARQKEEDQAWLEREKARLGEAELSRLHNQALSRCGLAYQLARSEEVRGAIREGELNAMLLEQRDSDI